MADVKVLIGEKDGEEYDYPTEYNYTASDQDFDNQSNGFVSTKTQAAIEEARAVAVGLPRFPFTLIHNGTLSNGQAIRWSNLANNSPLVVPVKSVLAEVTFSNVNDADANFRFYRNTVLPANLFFTWDTIRGDYTKVALSQDFQSNPTFEQGEIIEIEYDDQGKNVSDMVMVLFFQAVI